MCRIPDGMKWSFSKLEAFHHCGMMDRAFSAMEEIQSNKDIASMQGGDFPSDMNSRKERGRVFRIARSDSPPAF